MKTNSKSIGMQKKGTIHSVIHSILCITPFGYSLFIQWTPQLKSAKIKPSPGTQTKNTFHFFILIIIIIVIIDITVPLLNVYYLRKDWIFLSNKINYLFDFFFLLKFNFLILRKWKRKSVE